MSSTRHLRHWHVHPSLLTMSTPNVHQERRDFLIETSPYKSIYECASAFYNQFHFKGKNAAHDALLKSLQGVQSEAAYQGYADALHVSRLACLAL